MSAMSEAVSTPASPTEVIPTQPVAIPVMEVRKSGRTRTIKTPYDPDDDRSIAVASPIVVGQICPSAGPPQSFRIIIERENLQVMLSKGAVCRKCKKGELVFATKDIGVPTSRICLVQGAPMKCLLN